MSVAEAIRPLVMGLAQGRVALPDSVIAGAAVLAKEFYANAVKTDFTELVETFSLPAWLKATGDTLIPDVEALGFTTLLKKSEVVATAGVDQHVDAAHGFVLLIVLHNDGLKFRQGKGSHKHLAGEWFIFDDRREHGVKEIAKDGAYVGWAIPLKAVK